MFEHERLDLESGADHPEQTSVSRWSNYLSWRLRAGENATMIGTVYVQPQFDDPEDARIVGDVSLGAPLNERVSLAMSLFAHYDSRQPDGKEPLDMTVKTGVAIAF